MPHFRAIHTIELKPNIEPEVFEDFMTREFLPTTRSLPGCLQVEFLKGYKGELVGVAPSKCDYGWLTLWESVEANDAVWAKDGAHYTPTEILEANAKLYHYAASYSLVGGFTVEATV
jgi:hypothetical protein